MHRVQHVSALFFSCFIVSIGLSGCGGSLNFPDSVVSPQVQGPPMQGSVFGGHAPIVGSHVYILQPGTTGPGSAATSLLGNNGATSASGYAISTNSNDPSVPAGAQYVTTDSNGAFNLTGGYTCTAGQPVYLYSYGGKSPSTQPTTTNTFTLTTADISQIVVTNAAYETNGTATYAITLTSNEQLTSDENVTIAGLTGNLSILNGTQTVLASPSASQHHVFDHHHRCLRYPLRSSSMTTVANGTYTPTTGPAGNSPFGLNPGTGRFGANGTATGDVIAATTSPIVELATLGVCPANVTSTTGNFSSGATALSYVYINEVSTVATAYTFQPFTLATNNNAWDVGTSGTTQALAGINTAAETAAQLYNIQGSSGLSSTQDGEGHIANAKTMSSAGVANAGNGTVPQAEIDTLANVLAACLDSTPGGGGLLSNQCSALFTTATDNGQTNGTEPTDIATAAINIARYPSGNSTGSVDSTYASDIYNIPSGTVPYAPQLTAAPTDWTIAITYTGGGIVKTNGKSPHSIAVDYAGDVYTANYSSNTFTQLSPLGIPASTAGVGSTLGGPSSIAVDSTSRNVWLANATTATVSRCTTVGTSCVSKAVGRTGPQDAEIDGSGYIWVSTSTQSGLVQVSSAATPVVEATITTHLSAPNGVAIQSGTTGNVWVADSGEHDLTDCSQSGVGAGATCAASGNGGADDPNGAAIDSAGNVWATNADGSVTAVTSAGAGLAGSSFTPGSGNYSDGVAIDGNDNVWVTNSLSDAVYVLNNSGAAITTTTGYKSTSAYEPDGISIDPSGNVWYNTVNGNVVVELVGAAAPTVTPLSYAVTNSMLGAKP